MASPFNATTTADEVVTKFVDQVKGNYFLVTGPTAGTIGAAVLLALAKGSPAGLILAGRTPSKFQAVVDEIKVINPNIKVFPVILDLISLESVRKAAQEVLDNGEIPRLDHVINNAGVMAQPFRLTEDGIESQFAANHVGHFLLTNLLLSKLKLAQSGTPSVVNVSSAGHRMFHGEFTDPSWKAHSYNIWEAYGQSKAANIVFSKALSKRHVRSMSVDPGLVLGTQLGNHLTFLNWLGFIPKFLPHLITGRWEMGSAKTTSQAAATVLVAALDTNLPSGSHLYDCQVSNPDRRTLDERLGEQLWTLSNELVKEQFL